MELLQLLRAEHGLQRDCSRISRRFEPRRQHITDGGMHVDTNLYSSEISQLISAIIIYLCGFVLFTKYAFNRILQRKEEKERQAKAAADNAAKNPEGGDAK